MYLLVSVTGHERRLRNLKRVQEFLEQERQIQISMEEGRGHRHVILANFLPLGNVCIQEILLTGLTSNARLFNFSLR